MEFLTVILIIAAALYLLPRLLRWWIGRKLRQFQQQAGGAAQARERSARRTPREGEVKVETGTAPGKKVSERVGDYVEFEEVACTDDEQKP